MMLPLAVLREIALACSYRLLLRFRLALLPERGDITDQHFWKDKYERDFPTDRTASLLLQSKNYYTQNGLNYQELYDLCYDMKEFWDQPVREACEDSQVFFDDLRSGQAMKFYPQVQEGKGILPGFTLLFVYSVPPFELDIFSTLSETLPLNYDIELGVNRWIDQDDKIAYCVTLVQHSSQKVLMPLTRDADMSTEQGVVLKDYQEAPLIDQTCLSPLSLMEMIYRIEEKGYRLVTFQGLIPTEIVIKHNQYFVTRR